MEELNICDLHLIDQLIDDEIKSCKWRASRKYNHVSKDTFEKRLDELKLLQLKVRFKTVDWEMGD